MAAVATCAPGNATRGVLSGDRLGCAYATGAAIRSPRPLTELGDFDAEVLDFELDVGGNVCAHYHQQELASGGNTRTLLTSLGTVTWRFDDQLSLVCPDGSRFAAPMLDVLDCDGLFDIGWSSGRSESSVSFAFLTRAEPIEVFDCRAP